MHQHERNLNKPTGKINLPKKKLNHILEKLFLNLFFFWYPQRDIGRCYTDIQEQDAERERSRNVVFIKTERIHWVANVRSAEIASSSRNSKPSWNFRTPGIKRSLKFIERTEHRTTSNFSGILDLEEDGETFPKHRENLVLSYS